MHHKIREYLPNGNKTAGRNSIYLTTKYISYRTLMEEKHTKKDTAYHMKKERNNGRKASSEMLMIPSADADLDSRGRREFGRRSFLKGLGNPALPGRGRNHRERSLGTILGTWRKPAGRFCLY